MEIERKPESQTPSLGECGGGWANAKGRMKVMGFHALNLREESVVRNWKYKLEPLISLKTLIRSWPEMSPMSHPFPHSEEGAPGEVESPVSGLQSPFWVVTSSPALSSEEGVYLS